jgi:cell wall-associated NlpC family hydrolase
MSWVGTPYHSNARVKGAGVDCAQMPIAVYHACGLIPDLDPEYSPQWHLHHDDELYLDQVRQYAREIAVAAARPGDFLVWRFDKTFSHGAIVVSETEVVHALIRIGVTVSHWRQHSELSNRPVRAFTLWD